MQEFEITYQVSYAGQPVREFQATVKALTKQDIPELLRAHVEQKLSVMIMKTEIKKGKKQAA